MTAAAAAIILWLSASLASAGWSRSVRPTVLQRLPAMGTALGVPLQDVYLLRGKKGFELIDPDVVSWDRMSKLVWDRPDDVIQARYISTVERRGWWYPILESGERAAGLSFIGANGPSSFTDREIDEARGVYLRWLAGKLPDEVDPDRMGSGLEVVDRVLWGNVAGDVGPLLVLGLLLVSLAGMVRSRGVWIAERRLRFGQCGACRYELTGIDIKDCSVTWPGGGGGRGVGRVRE